MATVAARHWPTIEEWETATSRLHDAVEEVESMVWRLRETAQADTPATLEVIGTHAVISNGLQADSEQLARVVEMMAQHHSPLEEIWREGKLVSDRG
jgi:hypothetical protein